MVKPGIGTRHAAYYGVIDDERSKVRANLERRLAAARTIWTGVRWARGRSIMRELCGLA
jgi:hypothetical protein